MESDKLSESISLPFVDKHQSHKINKTLFFRGFSILTKMKLYVLAPICRCSHTVGSAKLRFSLVSAKIPNYLLWKIYAYGMICMGLRRQYVIENWNVKWIFLAFSRRDSYFWKWNIKYLHFSTSVKPDQTSASKPRNKGL